jgi:hypothetical protein
LRAVIADDATLVTNSAPNVCFGSKADVEVG